MKYCTALSYEFDDVFVIHGAVCSQLLHYVEQLWPSQGCPGLNLGLRPANEGRRYKVTPYLIGWAQNLESALMYVSLGFSGCVTPNSSPDTLRAVLTGGTQQT